MRVLFAARIIAFKDPLMFIHASQHLKDDNFVIAGDGKLFDKCKKLAGKNVMFLGWVSQQKVNEEMDKADVFCQLSPIENIWSSSLIYAMKCKKAIVCTDAGFTKQFLHDGVHCLLVPIGNAKLLVDALVRLQDETLRKRLGGNAFKYYCINLEPSVIVKKIKSLLETNITRTEFPLRKEEAT